jgi:hypothetical protein
VAGIYFHPEFMNQFGTFFEAFKFWSFSLSESGALANVPV